MKVFQDFLAKIDDPNHQDRTEEVLTWVADTYPNLVPVVKWNQPMFTDHDTFIIGFSVSKNHLAVAPEGVVVERFSSDIVEAGYNHTKQLMQIKWNSPVNYELLAKIIEYNIREKADCTTFWRK